MITIVEKCIKKVGSRFDLVVLGTYRIKEIMNGAQPLTSKSSEDDGEYTITLKEIVEDKIDIDKIRDCIVSGYKSANSMLQYRDNTTNSKGNRPIFRDNSEENAIRDLFSMIADEDHDKVDTHSDESDTGYDLNESYERKEVDMSNSDEYDMHSNESDEDTESEIHAEIPEEKVEEGKKKYAAQNRKNKSEPDLAKISSLKYVDVEDDD